MSLFRRNSKAAAAPGTVPDTEWIHVGAFGKHPGWDDHIEDLGIDTEPLVAIRQLLYVRGIGGNVDAGTWEKLDDRQRLDGYQHVLLWQWGDSLVAGRMWSSRDGKNRTRYPMVLVAQCLRQPPEWVAATVLPLLEGLQHRCTETTLAPDVHALLAQAQRDLRRHLSDGPTLTDVPAGPAERITPLLDRVEAEAGREGLHRLLYQMAREEPARRGAPGGSYLLRAPRCNLPHPEALLRWSACIQSLLPEGAGVLALAPIDGTWVDIIVGPPEPDELYCLRATADAVPLTTEIPYTIEPDLARRADEALLALRGGERTDVSAVLAGGPPPPPAPPPRPPPPAPSPPESFEPTGLDPAVRKALLFAAGAAGIVVLLALAWLVLAMVIGNAPPPPEPQTGGRSKSLWEETDDWADFCTAYHTWFGRFLASLTPVRTARWRAADPNLAAMLDELDAARRQGVPLDPRTIANAPGTSISDLMHMPPDRVRTPEGERETLQALTRVRRVESLLHGESWPLVRRMQAAAEAFAQRGWVGQGRFLGNLCDSLRATRGTDLAAAVDRVLDHAPAFTAVQALWERTQQIEQQLAATQHPLLQRFAEHVQTHTRAVGERQGPDGLESLRIALDALAGRNGLGTDLAAFWGEEWPARIDPELVRTDPPAIPDAGQPVTGDHFTAWLRDLRSGRWDLPKTDDPRKGWDPDPALQRASERIAQLRDVHRHEQAAPLQQQWRQLQTDILALRALPWNNRTLPRIREGLPDLQNRAEKLTGQVAQVLAALSGTRDEFVQAQPATVSSASPVLNEAWRSRLGQLAEAIEGLPELRERTDALREALTALEGAVAAPSLPEGPDRSWKPALLRALHERRERALADALGSLTWRDHAFARDDAFAAALARARTAHDRDRWQIAALVIALDALQLRLDLCYALDEPGPQGQPHLADLLAAARDPSVLSDPAVAAAARPVLDRLTRLEEVARMGREQLVELAGAADLGPDVLRTVWRRLGSADPAWPTGPRELEQEQRLWGGLYVAHKRIGDAGRSRQLQEELAVEGLRRWQTCFNGLRDPRDVDRVIALAADLGADIKRLERLGALDAHARFNLLLYEFRRAAPALESDEDALRARARTFREDVGALGPVVASAPAVAPLLRELDALDAQESVVGDPATSGPGASTMKWAAKASDDLRTVDYTWAAPRGGASHTLRFVRIDGPEGSGPPVYLLATEVPVGLFLDVTAAADGWRTMGAILCPLARSPLDDTRRGPRTWGPTGGSAPARASDWAPPEILRLYTAPGELYPAGAAPAPPSHQAPMQYVSLEAAVYFASLLGCRLPTSDEWRAGVAASGGPAAPAADPGAAAPGAADPAAPAAPAAPAPGAAPNLRDRTWERQKLHVTALESRGKRPWYPDEDIFWGDVERRDRKTGASAPARDTDDGVVWFANVDSPPARPIAHLVGNVAEYVCDTPAVLDALLGSAPSARAVHQLLQAKDATFAVVGGSAMSDPRLPTEHPYPIAPPDARNGYSDVGFRLAFPAPGESLPTHLARLLAHQPYLTPGP